MLRCKTRMNVNNDDLYWNLLLIPHSSLAGLIKTVWDLISDCLKVKSYPHTRPNCLIS